MTAMAAAQPAVDLRVAIKTVRREMIEAVARDATADLRHARAKVASTVTTGVSNTKRRRCRKSKSASCPTTKASIRSPGRSR